MLKENKIFCHLFSLPLNLKFNFLTSIMILILIGSGCSNRSKSNMSESQTWTQVPLTSFAQKEAGLMGGEGMQMIFDISYAPSNPQIVYLVTNTSQVWKSIDGGNSWQMTHKGFLSNGGIAVSVDPVNENIAFVSGSYAEPYGRGYSPADGIYRTVNGGEHWDLVKQTSFLGDKIEGKHFAFDQTNRDILRTNVIYAGTHKNGLLISKDGGDNWEMLGFKDDRIIDIRLDSTTPSVLYLSTDKGLFKITINDYVISQTEQLGNSLNGRFKNFALNNQNPLIMYAAMGKEGVYKSNNGGKDFIKLENGLPGNLDYSHIAVSPVNPDYLFLSVHDTGTVNPFWSHDGGDSWHQPQTLDKNNDSLTKGKYFSAPITPHPFEADIALTSASGVDRILKTVDGGITWSYSGSGYSGGRKGVGITSHAFYPDPKKMIFFLIDFGPALTVDSGESFRLLNNPRVDGTETTPVGAVSPTPDENIIVTAIGGWERQTLAVSRDDGENWKIISGTEDNYRFITFHPQKPNIIYAQGFISRNSGNSWEPLARKVSAIFRGNGDIVYSIDEIEGHKPVVRRSNDQGQTWTISYPELRGYLNTIYEIDVDPLNPDRIYVATDYGFYIFDDKNETWLKKSEESGLSKDRFGSIFFKCVAVDPKHPEVVYTGRWAPGWGHSNGIFRSVDYGMTWENITSNLGPEFTVWSISVSPHDGTVYIGSSHGTWKLPPPY